MFSQSRAAILVPKSAVQPESAPPAEDSETETSIPVFSSPVFRPYENSGDIASSQNIFSLHPAVQKMFVELNQLCTLMTSMPAAGYGKDALASFNRKLDVAEQHMFRLTHCDAGDANSPREALYKMRAYATAGTIFLYLYLRKIPPSSTTLEYSVANLYDSLRDGSVIDNAAVFPPEALLWILFMGGIASEDRVQRPWFKERASKTRATLAVDSWPAVQQILMKFPFTGSDYAGHCRDFWSELT